MMSWLFGKDKKTVGGLQDKPEALQPVPTVKPKARPAHTYAPSVETPAVRPPRPAPPPSNPVKAKAPPPPVDLPPEMDKLRAEIKRDLEKHMAEAPKATMTAHPVHVNPSPQQRNVRAAARLQRLLEAIKNTREKIATAKGDQCERYELHLKKLVRERVIMQATLGLEFDD